MLGKVLIGIAIEEADAPDSLALPGEKVRGKLIAFGFLLIDDFLAGWTVKIHHSNLLNIVDLCPYYTING